MNEAGVTSEWLSAVLDVDTTVVSTLPIGDGLVGSNLRVVLDGAAGAPPSVVVKLPSEDPTSRATGIALRNYEREVKFYREVATTVDIRVPHCYHAEWDEGTGDFVLVLEDMAPAEQGDQLAGCDLDRATAAATELARLHGPRWADPTLDVLDWLQRRTGRDDALQLAALWQLCFPGFIATYAGYLGAEARELAEWFGGRIVEWMAPFDGPLTVTHGDYRLDNLLFATAVGGPPVTAVDWQTPGHGSPVADLAYFCGAGLLPDQRRAHERDVIDAYVGSLAGYGVVVDESWLWDRYRHDAFGGVIMAVVASQVVGTSERSEAMFAAMATRHLQHALDLDSRATI